MSEYISLCCNNGFIGHIRQWIDKTRDKHVAYFMQKETKSNIKEIRAILIPGKFEVKGWSISIAIKTETTNIIITIIIIMGLFCLSILEIPFS